MVLTLVGIALVTTSCASANDASRQVLVSAAGSLTDVVVELETAFEQQHPDIDVVVNLGGSSALREQILAGAPIDVFASANVRNMEMVSESGLVAGQPLLFATNQLAIVVPTDNPAGVVGIEDLADQSLFVGLCAVAVPCGSFAAAAMQKAGVVPSVDTFEPDVRALLTKVEAGELDAAIVYRTDVAARSGSVSGIEIPDEINVVAEYPIALLTGGENVAAGELFVGFVTSETAAAILAAHGFGRP